MPERLRHHCTKPALSLYDKGQLLLLVALHRRRLRSRYGLSFNANDSRQTASSEGVWFLPSLLYNIVVFLGSRRHRVFKLHRCLPIRVIFGSYDQLCPSSKAWLIHFIMKWLTLRLFKAWTPIALRWFLCCLICLLHVMIAMTDGFNLWNQENDSSVRFSSVRLITQWWPSHLWCSIGSPTHHRLWVPSTSRHRVSDTGSNHLLISAVPFSSAQSAQHQSFQ